MINLIFKTINIGLLILNQMSNSQMAFKTIVEKDRPALLTNICFMYFLKPFYVFAVRWTALRSTAFVCARWSFRCIDYSRLWVDLYRADRAWTDFSDHEQHD